MTGNKKRFAAQIKKLNEKMSADALLLPLTLSCCRGYNKKIPLPKIYLICLIKSLN